MCWFVVVDPTATICEKCNPVAGVSVCVLVSATVCLYVTVRKKNGSLTKSDIPGLSLASAMDTLDFFHKQTLQTAISQDGQSHVQHTFTLSI